VASADFKVCKLINILWEIPNLAILFYSNLESMYYHLVPTSSKVSSK